MKKLLILFMSLLTALSLAACSTKDTGKQGDGGTEGAYNGPKEFVYIYTNDLTTLDYTTTNQNGDSEIHANLVDTLLENDRHGNFVGALAESWSSNEDATEWTFNIRKGVKWVTSQGEEYAEVTAHDFVTALQHAVEFKSESAPILYGVVKNLEQFAGGEVNFDEVGVKALDDHTLVYTLENSTPYFFTMTVYSIFTPINQQFLESKGVGCKLGAPNRDDCTFGALEFDSILYNGGYILTKNDAKAEQGLQKNEAYWDAENVFVETIKLIYDDGSDSYSTIKGFEQGTYPAAGLNAGWEDFDAYMQKYDGKTTVTLANSTAFGVNFNYNRKAYDFTVHKTDEDKANTQAAIRNENFRKAFRASFDRVAQLAISAPEFLAIDQLRNIYNYPEIVKTSDGKDYGQLVTEVFNKNTGMNVDLGDGKDPWLSQEEAAKYIAAAEADGIKFPVTLDLPTLSTSDRLTKNAYSLKESVEKNSGGKILIEVHLLERDTLIAKAYALSDPSLADYDINTFAGWGPDYADPKTFVNTHSPISGDTITNLGLWAKNEKNDPEYEAIKEQLGLYEFQALYEAADAITDDLDARYAAFAKADSYLIEHAILFPTSQQTRAVRVSKVVPFSRPLSFVGVSEHKYKGMKLQDDIVTTEQYEAAKAEWEKAVAK